MSTKIKPKFSFKLLSVLLAVLMMASSFPVAAGSAFAKDETNQISMTFVVTDTAEQPVKGATVEIRDNNTKNVLTTSTLIDRFKNTYETTEKFLWTGGNLPNTLVKSKKIHFEPRFFSNYLYHDDLYGQCYLEALEMEE